MLAMEGIKCVLLDIEGTICPISFVKDTLFPYALQALPAVLSTHWDSDAFAPYKSAFPTPAQASPEAFRAHIEDLTARDVTVASLKNLQGYLWENGYRTGAYATPLFPDVAPKLKAWRRAGFELVIYSSGSVFAQKLLFGHVRRAGASGRKRARPPTDDAEADAIVEAPPKKKQLPLPASAEALGGAEELAPAADDGDITGAAEPKEATADVGTESGSIDTEDLQHLISGWFDTTNAGSKAEASSYEKIAAALKTSPEEILFLSDNVKEVDAAVAAKMEALLVDRPGNAAVPEGDRKRLSVVESLDEVMVNGDSQEERPDAGKTANGEAAA